MPVGWLFLLGQQDDQVSCGGQVSIYWTRAQLAAPFLLAVLLQYPPAIGRDAKQIPPGGKAVAQGVRLQ